MNDECHISHQPGPGSTCPGENEHWMYFGDQGKCFGISKYNVHMYKSREKLKLIFDKVNSVAERGF